MVGEAKAYKLDISEIKRVAAENAKTKANDEKWTVHVAILLFAFLVIIILLAYQGIGIEIASPVAIFGLGTGWAVGWRQGRRLYNSYYDEELRKAGVELEKTEKETQEEIIRNALVRNWKEYYQDSNKDV
ncbi:hypothetical protein ACFLU1_03585 [Chloroflexota bacterium]